MIFYAATILLSAFLLFQVQPIMARMILPWFGGSSSVWSACMVFFQSVLLLGYLYAHWLHEKLSPKRQAAVHSALLAVSLAILPLRPDPSWKGAALNHPAWAILGLLCVTVGLPYLLLSTTGPLLQAWYAKSHQGAVPYRLYALSNFASLVALLSYPFLVEPNWTVRFQALSWSGSYAAFALLCAATAWRASAHPPLAAPPPSEENSAPDSKLCALWIALAACPSILLLASTTFLTQDVAAVPFLWILPLSIYLLTFILCFEAPRFYYRPVFLPLLVAALCGDAWLLYNRGGDLEIPEQIALATACLFVFCMVCHGELVRRKPHPRHLTLFYLMLSLGGALGGAFVGLAAPAWFNSFHEFPIGLALCAALAVVTLWARAPRLVRALLVVALCGYLAWPVMVMRDAVADYKRVERNFYSQSRVSEEYDGDSGLVRKLVHGRINHGQQFLDAAWRNRPVTYFCPASGIGQAFLAVAARGPMRAGVLGLGCGTLLAYGRSGDYFRIYEINRQVVDIARTEFSYMAGTPAKVETVLGDGRLMLERDPDQRFDILVMDAFAGDSIPTHLVTLEAFRTYVRHLAPGGILAVNATNRYLDLRPVVAAAAEKSGRVALDFSHVPEDEDIHCFQTRWILVIPRESETALAKRFSGWERLAASATFRAWTDDYSNMFSIMKK